MPYRFIDDVASADAAVEAWGDTPETMMTAAADALLALMVEYPACLSGVERRTISVEADTFDILLFRFLGEMVYIKDAEGLLLRVDSIDITPAGGVYKLSAELTGERADPQKHSLYRDVKAVTLHRLSAARDCSGWRATVVFDL